MLMPRHSKQSFESAIMIDLRPAHREAIERIAERIFPPGTEVLVYGSRVKGTAHDASDLDLVIKPVSGRCLDLEKLTDFIQALHDSTLPIIVQVFSLDDVPANFHKSIECEHEVMLVVGADESARNRA